MDIANLSAASLRNLITHLERRDALVAELKKLEGTLQSLASGGKASASAPAPAVRKRRKRRGGRKARVANVAAPAPKVAKAGKPGRPPKAAKAGKPGRPAKAGKPGRPGKGNRRGALKARILAELTKAGSAGIVVKNLAQTLKAKPQNIHVWFSSTGKNVPGLTKIGEGRYRLNA